MKFIFYWFLIFPLFSFSVDYQVSCQVELLYLRYPQDSISIGNSTSSTVSDSPREREGGGRGEGVRHHDRIVLEIFFLFSQPVYILLFISSASIGDWLLSDSQIDEI